MAWTNWLDTAAEKLRGNRLAQSALLAAGAGYNPTGVSGAVNQALQPVIGAQSQAALIEKYRKMMGGNEQILERFAKMLKGEHEADGSSLTQKSDSEGTTYTFKTPKASGATIGSNSAEPVPTPPLNYKTVEQMGLGTATGDELAAEGAQMRQLASPFL